MLVQTLLRSFGENNYKSSGIVATALIKGNQCEVLLLGDNDNTKPKLEA